MEMTYDLAHKQRLDIFTLTTEQLEPFLVGMKAAGRECFPFKHQIGRFQVQMCAVGKRPDEGVIAEHMKNLVRGKKNG